MEISSDANLRRVVPRTVCSRPGSHGSSGGDVAGLSHAAGPRVTAVPLLEYRSLIWNFAQRDLKARFKSTVLGWSWSLVVPLASLLIYSVVFSVIFRMEPPPFGNGREGLFPVWLFAGLTVWGFFSNSVNSGIGSLLATGTLLKKIYFPSYTPILGTLIAVAIQSLVEFGLLLAVLLILANVSWTWLLTPAWALLFFTFSAGLAVALGVLNVFFRDLAHIVSVMLQLLFYATPIIYTLDFIPETYGGIPIRAVIQANPLAQFVELFRDLVYDLTPGDPTRWAYVLGWTIAMVLAGRWAYLRRGRDLSEEL